MMCETVVIGAGVVGLAVARGLAMAGKEVIILESEKTFGSQTSSRNSSVIHAGIYYTKGSLKAQCCVQGKDALYTYLQQQNIAYRQCGKLIVATTKEELTILDAIATKAQLNGVNDLKRLSSEDVRHLEPEVHSVGGLFSPSTGIVDSHGYMMALLGDVELHGGAIAYGTKVISGQQQANGNMILEVLHGDSQQISHLESQKVINATGLVGLSMTQRLVGNNVIQSKSLEHFGQFYAKGNYFSLSSGTSPFSHLVYPVPVPGGLGVHATIDLGGQVRFGPDVEWVDKHDDYTVNVRRADDFYAEIRKYYPNLRNDALTADYSGIRPKLTPQGVAASDFVLWDGKDHGAPSLLSCLGIESPGLTSSLAIAERVVAWSTK
jgi:L-2-hydroxyglutarate oxidase LhgO